MQLVLLPGMDGTGRLFDEFIRALPNSFPATTVPYPTDRYLSYSQLEELVRAACPKSEPFVLLAESFSTPLAIRLAAAKPANLAGLVLCTGFATGPLRRWQGRIASLAASFIFRNPVSNLMARFWLVGSNASPELLAAVR
jgi:pimeloyl-[acyl-carrier protein] methyl ester esterase